jgi:acyl carrier protein
MKDKSLSTEKVLNELTKIGQKAFSNNGFIARSNLTAKDVHGWDSLNNIKLIFLTEEGFNIKIPARDISSFETLGDLVEYIIERS